MEFSFDLIDIFPICTSVVNKANKIKNLNTPFKRSVASDNAVEFILCENSAILTVTYINPAIAPKVIAKPIAAFFIPFPA